MGLGGPGWAGQSGPSAGPGFSVQLGSVSSTSYVPGHGLQTWTPQPCHCVRSASLWVQREMLVDSERCQAQSTCTASARSELSCSELAWCRGLGELTGESTAAPSRSPEAAGG